jgi:hypothetical protein
LPRFFREAAGADDEGAEEGPENNDWMELYDAETASCRDLEERWVVRCGLFKAHLMRLLGHTT